MVYNPFLSDFCTFISFMSFRPKGEIFVSKIGEIFKIPRSARIDNGGMKKCEIKALSAKVWYLKK